MIETVAWEALSASLPEPLDNFLAYWSGKRAGRIAPFRDEIDPAEFKALLPMISLVELCPDGRLRWRLVGTQAVDQFGFNHTGRYVDEVLKGERRRFVEAIYESVFSSQRPVFVEYLYRVPGGAEHVARRILLPLLVPGGALAQVITANHFTPMVAAARRVPIGPNSAIHRARVAMFPEVLERRLFPARAA